MENNMNSYTLSKQWFDWYSDTDKPVTSSHTAMFFYVVHVWNRSGQKENFGLPSDYAISELKMSNKTYYKLIKDLIDWGVIILVAESKNRASSRVIRMCNFYTPNYTTTYTTDYTADYTTDFHSTEGILNTISSNSNIDNNNNTTKKPRTPRAEKHVWAASPFFEYDKFEAEWIRLGEIETSQRKYKATDFDIKAYWLLLKSYGERNPNKMYVNWCRERRNWVVSNFNKGEKLILSTTYKEPEKLPEAFNNIKALKSAAVGENYNWAKRVAKNNDEHTAILVDMLAKEGVVLNNDKFEAIG